MSNEAATRRIEAPVTACPGHPQLRLRLPDGWAVSEVPLATFAIHARHEVDGFWVHALFDVAKVAPHVDLGRVADATLARLTRQDPAATVEMERNGRFGERAVLLRGVSATLGTPPRATTQLHALVLAPPTAGRTVTDLVTVVGSCPSERAEDHIPLMIEVIASLEFLPSSDR